ncbi:nitrite reductase small subunit NirD [Spirosoma sp. 209]|uniref:nitrite reductase small subunit NirD n=1 Tax=Spirosoma sp. 209 TaxID=1955701 RepID=UPI00098D6CD3|nr:nitrite reductase small subunit NirD [Spirosoma sp. 209]
MESITLEKEEITWHQVCTIADVPADGGACVLVEGRQIAIFNFARTGDWYATDNQCPHRQQMALARGMTGSQGDEHKVACPFHKKTFSLKTGQCLTDSDYQIATYPILVENGLVFVGL